MYRIIIADDEPIECRALERMIQECMDCCEVLDSVGNGLDLIRAVEEKQPDLVIVDLNMPGLNGLDAIEILRRKKKNLKIIINTAYSDFAYIKRAMKYQVIDYVLKPVKREELQGILKHVCAQLDEEHRAAEKSCRLEKMEGQILESMKNHFMDSLLLGEVNHGDLAHLMGNEGMEYGGSTMFYILPLQCRDSKEERQLPQRFMKYLRKRLEKRGILLTRPYQSGVYGLLLQGTMQGPDQGIFLQKMRETSGDAEAEGYGRLMIGVSEWKKDPDDMAQAARECQTVIRGRQAPGIYVYSRRNKAGMAAVEPLFEPILHSYFQNGLLPAINLLIQRVEKWEQDSAGISFSIMKIGCILCLIRIFLTEGRGGSAWIGNTRMKWEEWMSARDYTAFAVNLKKLEEICEEKQSREINGYIASALEYVEKEYHRDLSLEDVAEYVGITPFYMSRLFRRELQASFTEILTDMRMGKALELLWENGGSIREVSQRTGYVSLSYFYKVFKKYFGVTAGELLMEVEKE